MDPDFLHAYQHGIVIECADGITRRVYPRVFTYSADYPEKLVALKRRAALTDLTSAGFRVLVATIRDLGQCPCPLCLVTLDQVHLLGQVADERIRTAKARVDSAERISKVTSARKMIYQHGYAASNDRSEYFLKPESLVATEVSLSLWTCTCLIYTKPWTSCRMPFLKLSLPALSSIFSVCSWSTSCTNLSWVCGKQYSFTSSGCYTPSAKIQSTSSIDGTSHLVIVYIRRDLLISECNQVSPYR